MSHELQEHDQMISGRNITPWHELGEVKESFDIADLRRIMDWPVSLVPLITSLGDATEAYATVRMPTAPEEKNVVLGAGLSKNYKVLQNSQLIDIVEPFVNSGCALETAGTLKNGQRVWVMLRLAKDLHVGNDDVIEKYIMVSNDHTGRQAARIGLIGIRVVCQNTLNAAESDSNLQSKLIRVLHQGDIFENLKTVATMLDHVNGTFVNYAINLNALAGKGIVEKDLRKYVRNCLFSEYHLKEETQERKEQILKVENKVIQLFETGAGSDLKSANGTLYGAYQAINNYLNHNRDIPITTRLPSLVWGKRGLTDKKAFHLAMKLAA